MHHSESKEKEVALVAEKWVDLIDQDLFVESWNQSAQFFKAAVTSEQWEESLKSVRLPLGSLVSRELTSETFANELPGTPDGEYVVTVFETSFNKKKNSVETITLMKEPDSKWRVVGYFIR